MAIDVGALRHPKEKQYLAGVALVGGSSYAAFAILTLGLGPLLFFVMAWVGEQFFRASAFGQTVKVGEKQYPQIHQMVVKGCEDLGIAKAPDAFVFNADGMVNAFAVKFLKKKYLLLTAPSVELLLERGHPLELAALVGHELGHHAAGHTGYWKGQFAFWTSLFIPTLASAYSRACERTCDRIGAAFAGDPKAMQTALAAIASGSRAAPINLEAFMAQEADVPGLFGFLQEVMSSHPRTTLRVRELQDAAVAGSIPRRKVHFGGTSRLAAGPRATGAMPRPQAPAALPETGPAAIAEATLEARPTAPLAEAPARSRPPEATPEAPARPRPPEAAPQAERPAPPPARPQSQVPRPPDLNPAPRPAAPLPMANPFAEEGPAEVAHAFQVEAAQAPAPQAPAPLAMANPFAEEGPAEVARAFRVEAAPMPIAEAPPEAWPAPPSEDLWAEAPTAEPQVKAWTSPTGELFERVESAGPPPSSSSGTWESR